MKKSKKKDGVVHASKFQKWKKHGGFFVLFGMLPILLIYLLIRIIPSVQLELHHQYTGVLGLPELFKDVP